GQTSAAERSAHAMACARAHARRRFHALELSDLSGEYEINPSVDRSSQREVDARVRASARHGGLGEERLDVALRARAARVLLVGRGGRGHVVFALVGGLLFGCDLFENLVDRLVVRVTGVEDGAACLRGADAELGVVAVGASFGRGVPFAYGP